MIRSFKKAGLLSGILAVTILLQGCNIAAIMSAAGGILAGLGQAFGGQTGQTLSQVGQVLGGVGQAFGQQQQGVAGQLAGAVNAAGPLVNGGINVGQQQPGVNVGQQQPGINVGQQQPGINVGQVGNTGTVGLPVQPNAQMIQAAIAQLTALPPAQRTPQNLQTIAMNIAQGNQQLAQAIFAAANAQLLAANPQGTNIPNGVTPIIPQNNGGPLTFPQYPAGGGGNLFVPAYQATTGIIQLGQAIFGNNGQQGNGQPNTQQQQPGSFNIQPPALNLPGITLTPPGVSIKF